MSISDPAQLLQRIPELDALIDDPKIRHAIETGDPFKVFRALVLTKLFNRLPRHRALLKMLTGQRRLFAKPLKGTPALGSINSVGFGFVGESERDTDGSHIALHAFVVLFAIPIIPLGSYVVMTTGKQQWRIFARAPLGIFGWLYTRGLALMLVMMVLLGATHSYHQSSTQDLTILNGFEKSVIVNIDGKTVTVPAQGQITMNLKAGPQNGSASMDKIGVIDSFKDKLESSTRTSLWNIAGAAPLVRNTIVYTKKASDNAGEKDTHTIYCGTRFLELSDIKYAFVEPPTSISMSKHQSVVWVNQIMMAKSDEPGVTMCVNYAIAHQEEPKMAAALETLAVLHDWEAHYGSQAIAAAKKISRAEALRVTQRALQANNNLDTRIYQEIEQELRTPTEVK